MLASLNARFCRFEHRTHHLGLASVIIAIGVLNLLVGNRGSGVLVVSMGVAQAVVGCVLCRIAQHKLGPIITHSLRESIVLPHRHDLVWSLVHLPENAALTSAHATASGRHVEGTPPGLGARHAFVGVDGTELVIQLVDYEEGVSVTTVQVSPPPTGPRMHHLLALAAHPTGCELTIGVDVALPEKGLSAEWAEQWGASVRQLLGRIERVLADGWRPGVERNVTSAPE